MELKQKKDGVRPEFDILLIVPYGIETKKRWCTT